MIWLLHLAATDHTQLVLSDSIIRRIRQVLINLLHGPLKTNELLHFLRTTFKDPKNLAEELCRDPVGGMVDGDIVEISKDLHQVLRHKDKQQVWRSESQRVHQLTSD